MPAATRTTCTSPTAPTISGPEQSPGYAVVNLGARYQCTGGWSCLSEINNLFDRQYYTAAQLGPTGFTDTGNFIARPFPAVNGEFPSSKRPFSRPARPGAWGGIRLRF